MTAPTVSVLIPTYNPSPVFLAQALDSLKTQTYTDWTVLIHDDCSETNVRAMVEPYLADTRFTFVRSDKRLGIGGNWNACMRQTDGMFVAYLFQDDLWAPRYLESALQTLHENSTVGFVSLEHEYRIEGELPTAASYQAVKEFRSTHVKSGFHRGNALLRWWIERELTPNIIGEPSFVVLRREAMQTMGSFLIDMPQFLDVEYWTRLLLVHDWYFLRGDFGVFRVHGAGASAVNQEEGRGLFDRLRCFEILISTLEPDDRRVAIEARSKALARMVRKFWKRLGSRQRVSAEGGGNVRKFFFRHPVLLLRAVLRSITTKEA